MNAIEVKNLKKTFAVKGKKEFVAVDDVSFVLHEGEILGLLCPNGAGKTTTIQMLMGVLTPNKGEVKYFGEAFAKHRERIMENVSFSSTYTNLPWRLSVKENLTYISYLYEIEDRKKRVEEIISLFHLKELENHEMEKLSAGELTRVNLAKAFLNSPRVLLLDEPTASLDPDVADYVRSFLLNERKEFKASILITSHNMSEVEELCDRVIFINHGKIIADDTPECLAKTIEECHVELLISEGKEECIKYANENKMEVQTVGKRVRIKIKEKEIAQFLQDVTSRGIAYEEISIEKPTLEDYFLHMTRKNKEEK